MLHASYHLILLTGALVNLGIAVYAYRLRGVPLAAPFVLLAAGAGFISLLEWEPGLNYHLVLVILVFVGMFLGLLLLLHRNMLDISPVARNLVMETIEDLVIVLDGQDRIVDCNPVALAELGLATVNGSLPLEAAPPEWRALLAQCLEAHVHRQEVFVSATGQGRVFDLTVSPIPVQPADWRQAVRRVMPADREAGEQPHGHLVLLHDISERKQVEQELRQRNRDLADLNAIVSTITSSLALEQVLQHILDAIPRFFPNVYNAAVQLVDEQDGLLHTRAASHNTPGGVQQMSFLPGEGIAGLVFQERRPFNSPDVLTDPRYTQPVVQPAYRSLLAVPLLYQDQAFGALCITSREVSAFDEKDVALLESLTGYAVIAVQNARLYEQTRRDAQTQAMLLREVNHRVKNNLVSILTLISFEMSYAGEHPAAAILKDLRERIKGLLVVHDMLSEARWVPLPVRSLVEQTVRSALAGSPIRSQISLQITGVLPEKQRWLAAKEATGLGLVMNELVTNSVKHAFTGRSTGVIEIQLRALPDEQGLEVRYRDDGPGWPEDVLRGEREHIGLGLIRSTVRDRMTLSNEQGAVATIVFR